MIVSSVSEPIVRRHFGTDGVRGIANTELSPTLALALGASVAYTLREAGNPPEIVIGRDPRLSGDMLQAALIAGICSQGVQVAVLGVVPTPGVAYITRVRGAGAGAVISASHNPMEDNGIKFFGADGRKLSDALEAQIESHLSHWESLPRPMGVGVGRVLDIQTDMIRYAEHLKETLAPFDLSGWRLVIDGANGAASYLAPVVMGELGAEVLPLSCHPDGININANCGSLHPEAMAERVVAEGAFAGIAFDGDADRVILSDEKGNIFDGDRILCAVGKWLQQQGKLPNHTVVGTIMSNMGLEVALGESGVRLIRANVGDRYVAEQMRENGAVIGGEKSGHILFANHTTTGDGILTALQILRICRESGRSLSDWASEMTEYPQKLVSIPVRDRDAWKTNPAVQEAIHRAEAQLGERGRINVRPSGTEKKIRVMVEAPNTAEVESISEAVVSVVRTELGVA
jgi:phosphoglucosamine mutase